MRYPQSCGSNAKGPGKLWPAGAHSPLRHATATDPGEPTISVFDFADDPSVAYTECNGGGMIVESAAQVAGLMTTVDLIRAVSLPPRESMDLIMQIRSEIDDE